MHLIVLSGPTASGKTRFAIQLAQHYNTVIVSADSRQFFREMTIGTAKPDAEELAAVPHYFINSHSVEKDYSVGQYEAEALELLQGLFKKQEVVILTGGSGLYLKAVCEGLDTFPEVPKSVQAGVEADYENYGLPYLQEALKEADPEYYAKVDLDNPHRLLRALSVCRGSGQPFSSFRQKAAAKRPFRPIYLQLQWPRATLYNRINQRVDLMMSAGLLEEARLLYPKRHLTALQTVGYQELFDYFDQKTSLEEAVALIKRNTRRYAKRQLTWFRRDGFWKLFSPSEQEAILKYIDQAIQHQLTWSQERHEDKVDSKLHQNGTCVAHFERTLRKDLSLTRTNQVPPPPLSWILWHQLRLLAMEDEAAYLHTDMPMEGLDWSAASRQNLPAWMQNALPDSGPVYGIPR